MVSGTLPFFIDTDKRCMRLVELESCLAQALYFVFRFCWCSTWWQRPSWHRQLHVVCTVDVSSKHSSSFCRHVPYNSFPWLIIVDVLPRFFSNGWWTFIRKLCLIRGSLVVASSSQQQLMGRNFHWILFESRMFPRSSPEQVQQQYRGFLTPCEQFCLRWPMDGWS